MSQYLSVTWLRSCYNQAQTGSLWFWPLRRPGTINDPLKRHH
jgi:hypothetical protein